MDFNQFKGDALRTESIVDEAIANRALFAHAINLAIASTEIMDQIKKNIFYGRPLEAGVMASAIRQAQESSNLLLYSEGVANDTNTGVLHENLSPRVLHGIIGKFTEAGELLQAITAVLNGEKMDVVNIAEELGDDQWYNAILADELNLDMGGIQNTVIAKLRKRYPEKFTQEAANDRDLAGERAVLEAGVASAGG